jgi:pimeloyl-ACP methyl ester carboxylesterase
MKPESWEGWAARLRDRGYEVLAPAWPHDDRLVADLRANPAPELASVGVEDIVAHYEGIVRGLAAPPILIGHSFGGLFTQLLLGRGLGVCGVAIDPAPIKGVLPAADAVRAAFPVVSTWGASSKVFTMSLADFQWGWVHTLPADEQRRAYDRYVVPTPGKPYIQGLSAPFTKTFDATPKARTAPLLLIAGEDDRTVPASMVRGAYKLQQASSAPTELKSFAGRTHWICGQPGWEEVCDAAIGWVEGLPG